MVDLLKNPRFVEFIDSFAAIAQASQTVSFQEARRLCTEFFLPPNLAVEPVKQIEDKEIRGADENLIPLRVYTPKREGKLPIVVFFHRGGWVFGNIEESDPVCRKLANHLNAIIISVDYRLCPENPFPKPLDDCYAAAKWAYDNADDLGGDKEKVVVCGESAGGNLAAAVALMARDKKGPPIAAQVLLCPIISSTIEDHVYDTSVDKYFITKGAMNFFWSVYIQTPDNAGHPYAALERTKNLAGLPPAVIVTAEYDPLHQEAVVFGERLKQSGVKVSAKCFPGVIHGFIDLPIYDNAQKDLWIDEIASLLKKALTDQVCRQ